MNLKICSRCGKRKRLNNFYLRKTGPNSGKYYEKCKKCMKKRGRKYYHDNRERQLGLALIRRKRAYYEKRKIINDLKKVPCADCGQSFPYYIMDFDHRVGTNKLGNISHLISLSMEKIRSEIGKCDIVCANCHRIRTYGKKVGMPS